MTTPASERRFIMKKKLSIILIALSTLLLCCGCSEILELSEAILLEEPSASTEIVFSTETAPESTPENTESETTVSDAETQMADAETDAPLQTESAAQEFVPSEDETLPPSPELERDGSYTTPQDVADYIHTFGTLPGNFITKKQAQKLGWESSAGNLWDVAPGKSIGGDKFGNYEGILPDTTSYHECDVNYDGGFRDAERIIYGDDGSIYYTNDHYKTFTQLY